MPMRSPGKNGKNFKNERELRRCSSFQVIYQGDVDYTRFVSFKLCASFLKVSVQEKLLPENSMIPVPLL